MSVSISGDFISIKGAKGEIKLPLNTKNADLVSIDIIDKSVVVTPKDSENKASRVMWGTMTRNIKSAISGVKDGFIKEMYMDGVGYKASVKGKELVLVVGFSHDVVLQIPEGLSIEMGAKPTEFAVKGFDKCLLGQFADKIHKIRKADPYKGKGIFYKGERIHRKEGKKK